MKCIENRCCCCSDYCVNCGLKQSEIVYCDNCNEELDKYYLFEGQELCEKCLEKELVDRSDEIVSNLWNEIIEMYQIGRFKV